LTEQDGSQDWIAAGLAELADGGVERVRVEVLAQRLGVTKGGFYRRFRDRRALLEAILENWVEGRRTAIERQAGGGGRTATEKLRSLITLYSEHANAQGMAIELAVRQWARTDPTAARAAGTVDAARLRTVAGLYRALGISPAEADGRAVLFYSFLFGQGLLFLDETPRKRAKLLAACADRLMEVK